MTSASLLSAVAAATGSAAVLELVRPVRRPGAQHAGGRLGRVRKLLVERTAELARRVPAVPAPGGLPAANLHARLEAAGAPFGLGAREWGGVKALCALAGLPAGAMLGAGLPGRLAVIAVPGGALAGFLAPDVWLARVARRRADAALRQLPGMLDLLRVTVEAGMPPTRALGVVGAEFDGPLAREWRRASAEAALGLPEDQAVAAIARRLPDDEVRLFCDALRRSRRHGAPLGKVLARQALRARHRHAQRVREAAARSGPKMQLVVALLLVPSVLLLVAAGIAAELERSGLGLPA